MFEEDFTFNSVKKVLKYIFKICIIVIISITIYNSFYTVGEQENVIVTQFGKIVRVNTNAGLSYKIPFIQRIRFVNTAINSMAIGYKGSNNKYTTIVSEGIMITSDFNFVNVDFFLEYKVSDPIAYIYSSNEPESIMKNMALSCIRNTIIRYDVDSVITTAKQQIQYEIKQELMKMLEDSNIGLQIINLSIQDAVPPTEEIIKAFKEVETAKQDRNTEINKAKRYESEELPKAMANVDKIIQNAEAKRTARIAEAKGQVERFNTIYNEYKNQTYIARTRLYYETIEKILPDCKVYILDSNTNVLLPLENFNIKEK